ncbi:MAG: GNAT family N-acetyltransferase, partial [Candidatus Eremiobacteraeota bacterium]|nr:GNAT family N-acetyltransferase [Candidatus Eremiobacteraeota bacterium]
MKQRYLIRPVCTGDTESILNLFASVASEGRWIGTETGFDRERYAEFIRAASQDSGSAVAFVCTDNGRPVGQISAHRDPHDARWDLGMLVLSSHRKQGLGRALLAHLIEWARKQSIDALRLQVFPHNEPARALYQAFGFQQTAHHTKHFVRSDGERWDVLE